MSSLIKKRDLIDLEERLKEVSELSDRTHSVIAQRKLLPDLIAKFQEHFDPMAAQIDQWAKLDRSGRDNLPNLAEQCSELSIELADSLKLALQIDQLVGKGQMSIVLSQETITVRQLTNQLDEKLEAIMKQLTSDKELGQSSSKNTREMLRARIEKNMAKLDEITSQIDAADGDCLRALRLGSAIVL